MRLLIIFLVLIVSSLSFPVNGKAENGGFEGIVSVAQTRGGVTTTMLYTRKGDKLRIENTDKSKPEPINLIDLKGNKLTIIYPHNSTFVTVDLTKAENSTPTGAPNRPPGFPAPPAMAQLPFGLPQAGVGSAPAMSPPAGFPTPPPLPTMPPRPDIPITAGAPGMPAMIPNGPTAMRVPMMMPGFNAKPGLHKTAETKKIQGYNCNRYTVGDGMQTIEIWATGDSGLFSFRALRRAYSSRRFGPVMLEEQWIELLRKESLFPFEAVMRGQGGGAEILSFKVEKIERQAIADAALFLPPAGFHEIAAMDVP